MSAPAKKPPQVAWTLRYPNLLFSLAAGTKVYRRPEHDADGLLAFAQDTRDDSAHFFIADDAVIPPPEPATAKKKAVV
jgi:hypothetical protein